MSERLMMYLCPILNVVFVLVFLGMAFASDEFVEEVNRRKE